MPYESQAKRPGFSSLSVGHLFLAHTYTYTHKQTHAHEEITDICLDNYICVRTYTSGN